MRMLGAQNGNGRLQNEMDGMEKLKWDTLDHPPYVLTLHPAISTRFFT
jgi:hypothetical protein